MKTEIKISAIAYDLELVDLRTHERFTDRIVLDRSWLDVLNKVGMSDRDLIMTTYNKQGYYLLQMVTRKKVTLTADLEELYNKQVRMEQLQAFGGLSAGVQQSNQEAEACDE